MMDQSYYTHEFAEDMDRMDSIAGRKKQLSVIEDSNTYRYIE
jgi:hypothetical protein